MYSARLAVYYLYNIVYSLFLLYYVLCSVLENKHIYLFIYLLIYVSMLTLTKTVQKCDMRGTNSSCVFLNDFCDN